jgi:hypothetical protein
MNAHQFGKTACFRGACASLAVLGLLLGLAAAPVRADPDEKEIAKAVDAALKWLARQQIPDGARAGCWPLESGRFKDRGQANDIAGTAMGLLPLLEAGHSHKTKAKAGEPDYGKVIDRGLKFLLRKQDRKTGDFGGGMYANGLATMAVCEAYVRSQDRLLRTPAQAAVNYLIRAQHAGGGWRYRPGEPGDTSVTSWQVQALLRARKAGLKVPEATLKKAVAFLDSTATADGGFSYTPGGVAGSPSMSAAGLTCRRLLLEWGPQDPRMAKGIEKHVKPVAPDTVHNAYFCYYAAKVMRLNNAAWAKAWNDKLVTHLVKVQQRGQDPVLEGSWSSVGDPYGGPGGRVMITSFNTLILQDYLPRPK